MTDPISGIVRRYILAALLVGTPILYLPSVTYEPFNLPKFVLLTAGLALVVAVKFLELARDVPWLVARTMLVPALATFCPLLVAWIFAPYRGWSFMGEFSRWEGLLPYLLVIVAALCIADAFRGRAASMCRLITLSGVGVSLLSLAQAFGFDLAGRPLTMYISGPMGNSNFLGHFLSIVLPIAVGVWISRLWPPIFGILSTALISTTILMSFSQGAWLASLAGVGVIVAAHLRDKRRALLLALGAPLLAGTIALGTIIYALVVPDGRYVDTGNLSRSLWWRSAVTMGADSPVVGHGPNGYAMDAVRYRVAPDALLLPDIVANGPHSTPLSFLVSAGLPGILGYLAAAAWAIRRAATLWRRSRKDVSTIFIGSLAAYLVGAIVNQHLMMEFMFWVSLAGLTVVPGDPITPSPAKVATKRALIGSYALAGGVLVAGVAWAAAILVADIRAQLGAEAFRAGDVDAGRRHMRAAISTRDDYIYRQTYADYLGASALRLGGEGRDLLREMDAVLDPTAHWPKLSIRMVHAKWLHEWSIYDPRFEEEALAIYEQMHADDPYNPNPVLSISDIYLQAHDPEPAIAELNDAIAVVERHGYSARYVDLWANLAIAHLQRDDPRAAGQALDRMSALLGGMDPTSCRTTLAAELNRRTMVDSPPSDEDALQLSFRCTPAQLRLTPDLQPQDVLRPST